MQSTQVRLFPQSVLNAIRRNDITALNAALDAFTPDDLSQNRKLMFPIGSDTHHPRWDKNTLECLTNPELIPQSQPRFTFVVDIDLLTLALHFVSTNTAFTQVVDQLLLWGVCPILRVLSDSGSGILVGNINLPISVVNGFETFIKNANNPPNAHLVSQRQKEIAATLQSCRDTFFFSDSWDIIQSYLTPITFRSQAKRVKRE